MSATPTGIFSKGKKQLFTANIDLLGDTLKAILVNAASPTFTSSGWGSYSDVTGELTTGGGYTSGGVTLSGKTLTLTDANSWGTSWAANTAYTVGQIVKPVSGNGYVYRCVVSGTSGGGVAPTGGTNASPIVVTAAAHGLSTGNAITIASVTGNTNMNAASLAVVLNSSTYNLMNPSTLALINGNGAFGGSPTIVPTWPTTIGQQFTDGGVTWVCFASTVLSFTFTAPSWSGFTGTADAIIVYKSGTGTGTSPLANPLICCNGFGTTTLAAGTLTVNADATAFILDLG
jgi:hypothetical protein